ncbi:MAG: Uncharacterized protein XD77_1064 [Marinimicrobia bacterium 46_47]|nr:MAG: Uncharacterized protein XD77_1064 [Marinimicrobia bacterium 46_47]KUK90526.1 MAG: hypothetical protein XE04_1429 [Marinimicrobia bacterium 46_43]HBY18094.1 hypothetical protein [Candidatus Neomarinimicrobiota bacterium]
MTSQKILEELEKFLNNLDIELEKAVGTVKGGYCRIREESVIVINRKIPVEEQLTIIANAIHRKNLDYSQLRPPVREFIERFKGL